MSEPLKPTGQERQDAIKILAEKYHITNLNKVNRDGETPLMSAAWDEENLDVMRLLITAGADVNMVDELGESALSTACNEGNTEAAKLLVGAGADVNVANDEGHTSLMSAAMWSDAELVEILLKAGANLDAADDDGYTALNANASQKEPWFAEDETECVPPLINALISGSPECVRLLLEYGAVPDLESDNGTTPLALAEEMGQEECAELIREALKK